MRSQQEVGVPTLGTLVFLLIHTNPIIPNSHPCYSCFRIVVPQFKMKKETNLKTMTAIPAELVSISDEEIPLKKKQDYSKYLRWAVLLTNLYDLVRYAFALYAGTKQMDSLSKVYTAGFYLKIIAESLIADGIDSSELGVEDSLDVGEKILEQIQWLLWLIAGYVFRMFIIGIAVLNLNRHHGLWLYPSTALKLFDVAFVLKSVGKRKSSMIVHIVCILINMLYIRQVAPSVWVWSVSERDDEHRRTATKPRHAFWRALLCFVFG